MSSPAGEPSSVYGPVHSWRFGSSLGVDLLLHQSTCSFACVYCQLGAIEAHTTVRSVRVPTARVEADLRASRWRDAAVVTFSGRGEPTLARNLGETIALAHAITGRPIVVLTNALHLDDETVRRDLARADEVCCKLDAADDAMLRRVNRPAASATVRGIVDGIRALRADYGGRLSIQVMMLPRLLRAVDRLAPLLAEIGPDEVQLNVPSRPVPRTGAVHARGAHRAFDATRAARIVPRDELDRAAVSLRAATGLRVVLPPPAPHERGESGPLR